MIKRYTPSGTGMVEWGSGDYVRYDDHQEIMESIGAGGVSGRITKKTIEEHRAEFEEWANEYFTVCGDYELNWRNDLVSMAYIAWKAARGVKDD